MATTAQNPAPNTAKIRSTWAKHKLMRWFVVPVVMLLLANLPFWILRASNVVMVRPVFDMDVVLAMMVGTISFWLGALALVCAWIADVLQSMSMVYHFPSPIEFLKSFKYAEHVGVNQLLNWQVLVLLLPFLCSMCMITWALKRKLVSAPSLGGLLVALILIDSVNGSASWNPLARDAYLIPGNFSGSPSANLMMSELHSELSPKMAMRHLPPPPGRIDPVAWVKDHPDRNVWIVVTESLGEQLDHTLQIWLDRQLQPESELNHWTTAKTLVPFKGSTTHGELRVLCELSGSYDDVSDDIAANCLAKRFAAIGYRSIGLHGFSSGMFNRHQWWKTMGFSQTIFGEDRPSAPHCGSAFRGLCDSFLVDESAALLKQPRSFVYLLTLNTHLPLSPIEISSELKDLCTRQHVSTSQCQLLAQQGVLFKKIRAELAKMEQPPLTIVVGDHAPPFLVTSDRNQFRQDVVPQYVLTPQ